MFAPSAFGENGFLEPHVRDLLLKLPKVALARFIAPGSQRVI